MSVPLLRAAQRHRGSWRPATAISYATFKGQHRKSSVNCAPHSQKLRDQHVPGERLHQRTAFPSDLQMRHDASTVCGVQALLQAGMQCIPCPHLLCLLVPHTFTSHSVAYLNEGLHVGPEPLMQALASSTTFATQWFQMEPEEASKSPSHQASLQTSSHSDRSPWDSGVPAINQNWTDTRLLLSARPGSGGSPTARCVC